MLNDIRSNPLLLTDSYNLSHQFLKENTDWEVSHFYNRAAPMVLYGFKELVDVMLSIKITHWMIDEAKQYATAGGLPFPENLFRKMVDDCKGVWPLEIKCVPEGTYVPTGTPFCQVKNTKKGYGECVTWIEAVLMHSYFSSCCATRAFYMLKYLEDMSKELDYNFESFKWRFHMPAEWQMGSINALAHKVTQQYDNEFDCFYYAVNATAGMDKKLIAMVIDTYSADNVIENAIVPVTRYAAERGVTVIWRPDSGDLFGQACRIHNKLKDARLENFGIIIGEGMTFDKVKEFDLAFLKQGIPLTSIAYGIGAGFYKDLERDTLGWAMKTAYSNGQDRMKLVASNPIKQSIPGCISLNYDKHGKLTVYRETRNQKDIMEMLYATGSFSVPISKTNIANNAKDSYSEQTEIIICEEILEEIEGFKKKYLV